MLGKDGTVNVNQGVIHTTIQRWHQLISGTTGELAAGLGDLLADDVVFLSPVVFTPQQGKAITAAYLVAASQALAEGFTYTKQILDGNHAVLEFECTVAGKYVNGVDIITCGDDGRITEFRVMVRPLQAVNAVHAEMMQQLEALSGQG
jgi:hypothetical protein